MSASLVKNLGSALLLTLGLSLGLHLAPAALAAPPEVAPSEEDACPYALSPNSAAERPGVISSGPPVMQPQLGFNFAQDTIDDDVVERTDNIEGELSATWTIDLNGSKILLNLMEAPYFVDIYRDQQRHVLAWVHITARSANSVILLPYDPTTKAELYSEELRFTALPEQGGLQRATLEVGRYHAVTLTQNGLLKHSQIENAPKPQCSMCSSSANAHGAALTLRAAPRAAERCQRLSGSASSRAA